MRQNVNEMNKVIFKQWLIHVLLLFFRGLVWIKKKLVVFFRLFLSPIQAIGRVILRFVIVPGYRMFFFTRRAIWKMTLPVKRRATFLFVNRYVVHIVVAAVVAFVFFINLNGRQVRAESFGRESLLYSIVSQDQSFVVETVSSTVESTQFGRFSYLNDFSLSPFTHADEAFLGSDYVTTETGAAVSSPILSGPDGSLAPRDKVETYVVKDGDTLGQIADRFGLSLNTILWANNLTFRSVIRLGIELRIPPVDGVLYKVKRGDTVAKVAKTYNSETEKILAFNNLGATSNLSVGSELMIPGGRPPAPAPTTNYSTPIKNVFSVPSWDNSGDKSRGSAKGKGTWVWPSNWRVITQYYRGWRHTGLDIDGDYSTDNFAASDGVVIWAGWRSGYGLTVEIDHGNGIVTRYAHHSKISAKVGDVVRAGDPIGKTGTTGRSTGTHLHFEVIKNGKFQNPLDYIR